MRLSGHVALARSLGEGKNIFRVSSYHDANELMSVADEAGCTAVHPGYALPRIFVLRGV